MRLSLTMTIGLFALSALFACAPEATVIPNISQDALTAMGPNQDLTLVRRNRAGCYQIQTDDEMSGYLTPVRDGFGDNVCDKQ